MSIYVVTFYFQSGLAKLIHAGPEWFISGETLIIYVQLVGRQSIQWMTEYPWMIQSLTVLTGVFELAFPLLFYMKATRKPAIIGAISFHIGVFAILDISFWH